MWRNEIDKWGSSLHSYEVYILHGKKININEIDIPSGDIIWAITNPETDIKQVDYLSKRKFDLMILDESIWYKSRNSLRTKGIKKLAKSISRVWELTGAPANRMID